jgi:hypothetical protein
MHIFIVQIKQCIPHRYVLLYLHVYYEGTCWQKDGLNDKTIRVELVHFRKTSSLNLSFIFKSKTDVKARSTHYRVPMSLQAYDIKTNQRKVIQRWAVLVSKMMWTQALRIHSWSFFPLVYLLVRNYFLIF